MDVRQIKHSEFKIPECILELEVKNIKSELQNVKNLYEDLECGTQEWYISKHTTLIHLDEAATMRTLAENDLKKVQLSLKSQKDCTFAINVIMNCLFFFNISKFLIVINFEFQSNQLNISNISTMDSIHIKPSDGSQLSSTISGNIKICGRNALLKIK